MAGTLKFWAAENGASGTPLGSTLSLTKKDRLADDDGLLAALPQSNAVTLTSANGAVVDYHNDGTYAVLTAAGDWNDVKSFKVSGDPALLQGQVLEVNNFVHTDVNFKKSSEDTEIDIDGAKRGTVNTGDGHDILTVGVASNGGTWGETFIVNTRGGPDWIAFDGADDPGWESNFTDGHTTTIIINTGSGDDVVDNSALLAVNEIKAGSGHDFVLTGGGDDIIKGGKGEDTLNGGDGDDLIYGGADHDTLIGGDGNDTLKAGAGDDELHGGAGEDSLYGGAGCDLIYGGADHDMLKAGGHHDTLYGGLGDDSLYGGSGDDEMYGDAGDDEMFGQSGYDTMFGGDGCDLMKGGASHDFLYGGEHYDTLVGGSGDDYLDAGVDDDTMQGGKGIDTLEAGFGDDLLYGGKGWDVAIFNGDWDEYDITKKGNKLIFDDLVSNRDGVDTLKGIEEFVFNDVTLYGFNILEGPEDEVTPGDGNLVLNFSFEEDEVTDHNGTWEVFSGGITHWITDVGPGIEIQTSDLSNIESSHRFQHVELDSHGGRSTNSNMYQDIATVGDFTFLLEFDYSARPHQEAETSGIEVYWDGVLLDTVSEDGGRHTDWSTHSYRVQGSGDETTRLEFVAVGTDDSYGGLVDNVLVEWIA